VSPPRRSSRPEGRSRSTMVSGGCGSTIQTSRGGDHAGRTALVASGVVDGRLAPLKTRDSRQTVGLCATRRSSSGSSSLRTGGIASASSGRRLREAYSRRTTSAPAPIARLCGGRTSGCSLPGLRHTYAALMISAGAHPKLLQAQMGHSSIRATLDLYGHLHPHLLAPVTQALDTLISAVHPGRKRPRGRGTGTS
jgi:hypothetical protein